MKNIKKFFSKASGFTLVELLVVIAILGVLATVLLAAINPLEQINKGNDRKVQADVDSIYQAAVDYATSHAAIGFPAAGAGNTVPAVATLGIAPANPYGIAYEYFIHTTGTINDGLVVCGTVKSKANLGAVAYGKFIATSTGKCMKTGAAAPACTNALTCP